MLKCNKAVAEYITFYAKRRASIERFWSVLLVDFCPEFLKQNEQNIKRVYSFKTEIRNEMRTRHAKI